MDKVLSAKTHPAEYLLHKYWARKPHNIISQIIQEFTEAGDLVVDPCCGSGVALKEAEALNRFAIGFDVNPIANLITEVLINPPSVSMFEEAVKPILEYADDLCSRSYTENGLVVKYCRHEQIVRCPKCGFETSYSTVKESGKKKCPQCNSVLRFNLKFLTRTKVTGVVLEGNSSIAIEDNILSHQEELSRSPVCAVDTSAFTYPFAENRRILAHAGMTTASLFTTRNFSILCALEKKIDEIGDQSVQNAVRLMVSASIAQCSRLIATRNNLSSGGPAWSVPGFWVPAEHLETNPSVHLRARYKKFSKGLAALAEQDTGDFASVECLEAQKGLSKLNSSGKKAQLVFFDPPYGDSVPYLEFSAIWNSFLRKEPDLDLDISVSDRMQKDQSWEAYFTGLESIVSGIKNIMAENGHLVITFNNNDSRAWNALLSALQSNGLICETAIYQIPAVVSSKAQMSINGSYISDIYSVFKHGSAKDITEDTAPVVAYLRKCAIFRGGRITRGMGMRLAMEAWMQNNVSASGLTEVDAIISSVFDSDGNWLSLKDYPVMGIFESDFGKAARDAARTSLCSTNLPWLKLYEIIANEVSDYGIPDMHEVKQVLEGTVTFSGKECVLNQPTLL